MVKWYFMDNFSSIFLTSSFSSLSSIDVQPVQPSILERVAPTTSVSGPEPATQWRAGPSVAQCEDVNPIIYAAVSGRSVETSILKNETLLYTYNAPNIVSAYASPAQVVYKVVFGLAGMMLGTED